MELHSDATCIDVAKGVYLRLPAADELTRSFDATQLVSALFDGGVRSFEAHIEARPGRLAIVGVNAIGAVLFSIRYDGKDLAARGVGEAQAVRPEYVLADVLISHWDAGWIDARLEGAHLVEFAGGRRLIRDGQPLVEITYESGAPWSGVALLVNHDRGYTLRIDNVAFSGS